MQKLVINSYDDFATHVGEVLGTSEWLEVSQERINSLPMPPSTTNGFTLTQSVQKPAPSDKQSFTAT